MSDSLCVQVALLLRQTPLPNLLSSSLHPSLANLDAVHIVATLGNFKRVSLVFGVALGLLVKLLLRGVRGVLWLRRARTGRGQLPRRGPFAVDSITA